MKPPKGYYIVTEGEIKQGDLLWDDFEWEPAQGEVGGPVTSYKGVARKK